MMDPRIPEPFRSALENCDPLTVCDCEAPTAETLYGRALARLEVGRDADARHDLEAAQGELGDACVIELVLLETRDKGRLLEVRRQAGEVLDRAGGTGRLRARALHVAGLIEGKLRNISGATAFLLEALDVYREFGDLAGQGRVRDTLGSVYASQGRLDLALSEYAISVAEKAFCGDRYGVAITLGNLGRVSLRAGGLRRALDCFELNYRMTEDIGDLRGSGRALNDVGRVRLAMGDYEGAHNDLERCLELACEQRYKDLEFFSRKELACVGLASGNLSEAADQLDLAEEVIRDREEPFLELLLEGTRAELLLVRGDEGALEMLERCARKSGDYEIPDFEINLWITLARAYAGRKLKRNAEVCLEWALERSRADGYERYLRPIREAIAELGCISGLKEEKGRVSPPVSEKASPRSYTIFEMLGGGGFGKVFRAFDPLRDRIVALKRFSLEKIYDTRRRRDLIASARTEVEAAARVRHPGVARVYAVGEDDEGGYYVAQEFVRGRPLTELMPPATMPRNGPTVWDPRCIVEKMGMVADALNALHEVGVVHRDVKPANIILRAPNDLPVLVDFGIAFLSGRESPWGAGRIIGTLAYMAPEQLRGESVDPRADIFSLGVVFYQWLTGSLPLTTETEFENVRDGGVPDLDWAVLKRVCDDFEPGLFPFLRRLMDPKARNRPTAREVAALCRVLASDLSVGFDDSSDLT